MATWTARKWGPKLSISTSWRESDRLRISGKNERFSVVVKLGENRKPIGKISTSVAGQKKEEREGKKEKRRAAS